MLPSRALVVLVRGKALTQAEGLQAKASAHERSPPGVVGQGHVGAVLEKELHEGRIGLIARGHEERVPVVGLIPLVWRHPLAQHSAKTSMEPEV